MLAVASHAIAMDTALFGTPTLKKGEEAMCVPIKAGSNAYIETYIKTIDSSDKVPVLLVHLTDILKIDNLPFMLKYNEESKHQFVEDDHFKLQFKERLEEDKYITSYLTTDEKDKDHLRLRLPVRDSGYYCVYVASSEDTKEFNIPIIGHNSYGYLNFIEYVTYSQSGIGLLIILLATGLLFRDLIKSVGSDFLNLNNISVVSKSAVFYVLLPNIGLTIITIVSDFALNHVAEKGFLSLFVRHMVFWFRGCYDILLQFMVLLFCQGYGVLYYHKQTKSYRELPPSKMKLAKGMLAANLIVFLLYLVSEVVSTNKTSVLAGIDFRDDSLTSVFQNAKDGLYFLIIVFSFVWFVVSIVQGTKTLTTIKEFPPYSSNVENYGEKNDSLRKALRNSLFLIFLIPIYATIFIALISVFSTEAHFFDEYGYEMDMKALPYVVNDVLINHSAGLYWQVWNQFIIGIVVVVGVFFIWVRKNQGLIIDQNEDAEYSHVVAAANNDSDPEFV